MSWPKDIITKKKSGVECYVIEDMKNNLENERLRKHYG